MHHTDYRNTRGREPRKPVEPAAAVDEGLHLIRQQIGAGRFDQMDKRQFLIERDTLRALEFLDAHRLHRAGIDSGIVNHDHRAHTAHPPDAHDQTTACNGALRVGMVQTEAGQRGQLQEGCARIEQTAEPVAWQQLAASLETLARRFGLFARTRFQGAQSRDEVAERGVVLPIGFALRDNARFKRGHWWPPQCAASTTCYPGGAQSRS
jgi:hypothetical protein